MSILLLSVSLSCSKAELVKNFDRTLPGEQRLFLSPSGYVMALQRSGGSAPIAQPAKAARFTNSGEVVLAGLRPWNSVDSTWARDAGNAIRGFANARYSPLSFEPLKRLGWNK